MLGRAEWDPEALRDRLRAYVTAYLHAPDAVGVIDATGFLKKGTHSAGVARHYSGMAGRMEHSQIGVFLTYARRVSHTLLDRALSLPAAWTDDRERCCCAGIPAARAFATKPVLVRQMRERTLTAGVVLAWITGDSIYGDDRALRQYLEEHRQAYVLAVSGKASRPMAENGDMGDDLGRGGTALCTRITTTVVLEAVLKPPECMVPGNLSGTLALPNGREIKGRIASDDGRFYEKI